MIGRIKNLTNQAMAHSGLRKYGTNMSWLFAEKIFRMIIGFTVGVYVARQLGPTQYGILNYAISIVAIFSIVAGLGLDSIVVRELVKYPEKRNKILGSTFILKLAGVFIMLTGIGITLYFKNDDQTKNLIILVIAAGYLFQVFQTIDFYFQSQVLSKYVAISQVIAWGLVSTGRVFFAWKGYPLIYFAWLEAINMCLMSLGYLFFYMIKVSHPFNWRFDLRLSESLLKNSWPLLLSGATGMIYMRIDQVMIGSMLGDTEVGYYAVAVRLSEIWYFFPIIVCSSLFPAIIRSKQISKKHYNERIQKLYAMLLWFSFLLVFLYVFLGEWIIVILYGKDYIKAVWVLKIYIFISIFVFPSILRGKELIAIDKGKIIAISTFLGAFLNIIMNYFFIRHYYVVGAAIATLCSRCIIFFIIPVIFKKHKILNISFFKALVYPFKILKLLIVNRAG